MRRLRHIVLWAATAVAMGTPSLAQPPDATIRIVWPYAPGGGGDTLARLVAEELRLGLRPPVIVENRGGADGRIGVRAVKMAAPDGTTLLLSRVRWFARRPLVDRLRPYAPGGDQSGGRGGLLSVESFPRAALSRVRLAVFLRRAAAGEGVVIRSRRKIPTRAQLLPC